MHLDRADLGGGGGAGSGDGHGAVAADGHGQGVRRHGDRRLQHVAAGRDQLAVGIGLQSAVAGVGLGTVRGQHLEVTRAVDHHVFRVAGLLGITLGVDALGGDGAHAGADLQAGRQLRLLRGLGAGLAHVLVQQVLEHGTRLLEAVGADVGEVVRDDVEVGLLRFEAGLGDVQRTDHGGIS
jgi:hypothetical protein